VAGADPLVAWVRATATRHGTGPAVRTEDRTITYRALLAEVDLIAGRLRASGVAPGDVVALHVRREPGLPALLLAAWEVGSTVAFIDSTQPAARIARCESLVRPRWRLANDSIAEVTGPAGDRSGASHILFTSGSTGRPAAVAVPAAALMSAMRWYVGTFQPTTDDRVGLLAGLGHDPLLRDILVPVGSGGVLCVPPREALTNPAALARFVRGSGLTILHGTPALLEFLLAGTGDTRLPGLRLVVSGGAPLTAELVRRLRRTTGAVVVNAYGATETPQIASCSVLPAGAVPDAAETVLGVGTGVAGAELLLDNETGEIVVVSPNLALGYLAGSGREDRFGPDPRRRPGFRAYRTGDRADTGPDGFRVVGRIDRELSLNGFRLAPEEIEDAALRHPAVSQAHATSVSGPVGELIGLSVALASGRETDPKALRAFLRSQLPGHAVPARIRIVPEFERGPNHKIVPPAWKESLA
jgi:acyl-coenzyme A synthetase/AMP-(fatty) acid ligase